MALVEYGVTVCPLCHQTLNDPKECIGFPHFIADEQDPLWPYSDAAFHIWCFDTWPKKNEYSERLRVFEQSQGNF